MHQNWISATALIALAACGGGNSGSDTATTTTPTLTQVPTLQNAVADGGADNPTISQSENIVLATGSSVEVGTISLNADLLVTIGTDFSISLQENDSVIRSFEFPDPSNGQGFRLDDGFFILPEGGAISSDQTEVILYSSPEISQSTFLHTGFGIWLQSSEPLTSLLDGNFTNVAGFYTATPTPLSNIPTSGSARYIGRALAADIIDGSDDRFLRGEVELTANFADQNVELSMQLRRDTSADGPDLNPISATSTEIEISGNRLAGIAVSDASHTGRIDGVFAGTNAEEIAGAFELQNANSRLVGAFAADAGGLSGESQDR